MNEQRQFTRSKFEFRLKLVHPRLGEGIFRTGDVSDGGVFLHAGEFALEVGDQVTVQIQDVPIEAPIVKMVVVRAGPDGFGLRFVE